MKVAPGQKKIIFDEGNLVDQSFEVDRDGELLYILVLSGGKSKRKVDIKLVGEGARLNFWGVFHGKKDDEFDVVVTTTHLASRTSGETLIKGTLEDSSRCLIEGLVGIEKKAFESSDKFIARTLLLSPLAKAELLPSLEIKNDDVQATHAVTVSQLSDDELFYLQSRGISEKTAKKILCEGFRQEVISKIPAELLSKIK